MREINTISPRKMASLWWEVRWVRGLVLMLIPVGIVDTVYTVAMTSQFGPDVEFNPVTRWFIASGLWPLWAIMNIMGFTFFCMLAGSYYLHTRNHPSGPDTFWLTLIISLRIAMVAYNVTFYYIPVVLTVQPPLWVGLFAFCGSLYLINNLFRRQQDLTWRSATGFVSSRLDDRYDARLIRSATAGVAQSNGIEEQTQNQVARLEVLSLQEKKTMKRRIWLIRGAYFSGFLLSYVGMAITLNIIAVLSDFTRWQYDIPAFNPFTGTIFMGSFVAILFFIGLSMLFLFRAFTTMDEGELPV
ncbi:MAG: hypothetical protein ACFFCT_03560 [Candidatus Odinarchaeota archaeon]